MHIHPDTPLRDLALQVPGATAVFARHKLDYCCSGARPLKAACAEAGIPMDEVIQGLHAEADRTPGPARRPAGRPQDLAVDELVDYLLDRFHAPQWAMMERVRPLMAKVMDAHGGHAPEIPRLNTLVRELIQDLDPHFRREEQVLFPYCRELGRAARGTGKAPWAPFGTVINPVAVMRGEHEAVGSMLKEMAALTHDYTPGPGACTTWTALYSELKAFHDDLIEHIHVENNVLFPKAIDAEDTLAGA